MASHSNGTTPADISNWMGGPQNQWSFHNVDKVLKTHLITRSSDLRVLGRKPRNFDDFSINLGQQLDLPAFLEATHADGLIVLHNGQIVFENYLRQSDEDAKHIVMSMTKSVTALVIGILQEQGLLHETDVVSKHVPEVAGTPYEKATIRQCLDMRAGIKYADGQPEARAAAGWGPHDGSDKPTNLHDFIASLHPETLEEDRFEYVSVNTDLLGWVAERASGKRFAKLVEELLWHPMGAENDALMAVDANGNARAAGGLCACLRDLARIGQLVVEDGGNVVPASWIHDMFRGGDTEAWVKGSWAAGFQRVFSSTTYHSCCVVDKEQEVVMMMGIHGQMLFADRKNGIVVVKTASQPTSTDTQKTGLTVAAFLEFRRLLTT